MAGQKIDLKNLDKSNWKTYRFEEIAQNISERIDPNNTDLEVYIGLEHIDSESLHIKRFGTPDDVNGQKLKFYKGDIIFGRRRAYQRKAGIATCDGFCSAHALVLRANSDVIDPQLFPFFLHSDLFMNNAVDISVGSLSPTINWGTLKNQEFSVPPKEIHGDLAELLFKIQMSLKNNYELLDKISVFYNSFVKEKCLMNNDDLVPLSKVIDKLVAGVSVNSDSNMLAKGDYGILKTSAVSEGFFNPAEVKKVIGEEVNRLKTNVSANSIIISRMNTVELVGANAFVDSDFPNLYLPDRLWTTVISRTDINVKYLWLILSSIQYRKKISNLCSGTSNSMKNISQKSLLNLPVYIPKKDKQDDIVKEVEYIEKAVTKVKEKIKKTINLNKKLINQVF